MKRIALTICGLALAAFAIAQQFASTTKPENSLVSGKADFAWVSTSFNFGKVAIGIPVTHHFTFTNTGNVPLLITSVQTPCGCTVTSYSNAPIQPGEQGFVEATYNAARAGQFEKPITVSANVESGMTKLTILGEVAE